jgi:hypothetical protein
MSLDERGDNPFRARVCRRAAEMLKNLKGPVDRVAHYYDSEENEKQCAAVHAPTGLSYWPCLPLALGRYHSICHEPMVEEARSQSGWAKHMAPRGLEE